MRYYRSSIPKSCTTEQKVQQHLDDLVTSSAPWRSMKTIVLGNGQIGKTTFVNYLKNVLAKNPLLALLSEFITPNQVEH